MDGLVKWESSSTLWLFSTRCQEVNKNTKRITECTFGNTVASWWKKKSIPYIWDCVSQDVTGSPSSPPGDWIASVLSRVSVFHDLCSIYLLTSFFVRASSAFGSVSVWDSFWTYRVLIISSSIDLQWKLLSKNEHSCGCLLWMFFSSLNVPCSHNHT